MLWVLVSTGSCIGLRMWALRLVRYLGKSCVVKQLSQCLYTLPRTVLLISGRTEDIVQKQRLLPPDLNPMDYCIWSEINRRMRHQEANWAAAKRESLANYLKRLRRTAQNLSSSFISQADGDMTVARGSKGHRQPTWRVMGTY